MRQQWLFIAAVRLDGDDLVSWGYRETYNENFGGFTAYFLKQFLEKYVNEQFFSCIDINYLKCLLYRIKRGIS